MKNNDSIFLMVIAFAFIFGVLSLAFVGKENQVGHIDEQTPIVIDDTTPEDNTPTYVFDDWTVNYFPNGATGEYITQNVVPDISFKIKSSNTFTREGYTLSGWNTKADGTGESYPCDEWVIVLSQYQTQGYYGGQEPETINVEHYCLVLYAQWEEMEE